MSAGAIAACRSMNGCQSGDRFQYIQKRNNFDADFMEMTFEQTERSILLRRARLNVEKLMLPFDFIVTLFTCLMIDSLELISSLGATMFF